MTGWKPCSEKGRAQSTAQQGTFRLETCRKETYIWCPNIVVEQGTFRLEIARRERCIYSPNIDSF